MDSNAIHAIYEKALQSAGVAAWCCCLENEHVLISPYFYTKTGIAINSVTSLTTFLSLLSERHRPMFAEQVRQKISTSNNESLDCYVNMNAPDGVFALHITGDVDLDSSASRKLFGTIRVATENLEHGLGTVVENKIAAHIDPVFSMRLNSDLSLERALLNCFINNANSAVSIKSLSGQYLLANRRFVEQFCPNLGEISGRTDFDVFDDELAACIRSLDESVLSGNSEQTVTVRRGSNLYNSHHFPIVDSAGEIYAVGQVITHIPRSGQTTEQADEYVNAFSWLLDSLHAYIWYVDCLGNVKYCNRAADRIRPLRFTKGKRFLDAIPFFDDSARRQRELMQVIQSGAPIFGSNELVTIGGAKYWFSVDKIPARDRNGDMTGVVLVLNDISKEVARERDIHSSDTLYKAFIATSTDLIWCYEVDPPVDVSLPLQEQVAHIDKYARLIECNQQYATMYGKDSPADMIGYKLCQSQVEDYLVKLERFVEAKYQFLEQESKRTTADGELEFWNMTAVGSIENGKLKRFWGTSRDVTERWRYLTRVEYQATHDSLTQLPNRIKLYGEIEKALRNRRPQQKMALLIIDLDCFREINATLGHHTGDKLLKQVGPRLESEMDDMPGMVARLGGDEFAIFLSSIRNRQQTVIFAQRILDAISQAFHLQDMNAEIRASIGISLCPDQADDVDTLMRYADVAMYYAKKETIGIATYHQDHDPHSPKRLALISELGRAIREDQLALRYQPKVDLSDNSFYGFEALLCWNHPSLGLVAPGEFIPLAESTGLIQSVTNWVLERSTAQIKRCYDKGIETTISINLSARNLLDEDIASNIASLLSRYNIPPRLLELEITEGAMMADPSRALATLNEIHELGVQLSIDDFGTGYSSLSYLKQLPIHTLKIDSSFVISMLEDEQDRIIVSSTINLAHNLRLKVVAEGVETQAAVQELKRMNCDYAQGYYFGRPISEDETEQWIEQLTHIDEYFSGA